MDKARPMPLGGEFEDMLEFLLHGLRRVAEAEANAETALRESLFDEIADGLLFVGCSGSGYGVIPGQPGSRVVHDDHARTDMTDAGAEVHQCLSFPLGIPGADR